MTGDISANVVSIKAKRGKKTDEREHVVCVYCGFASRVYCSQSMPINYMYTLANDNTCRTCLFDCPHLSAQVCHVRRRLREITSNEWIRRVCPFYFLLRRPVLECLDRRSSSSSHRGSLCPRHDTPLAQSTGQLPDPGTRFVGPFVIVVWCGF